MKAKWIVDRNYKNGSVWDLMLGSQHLGWVMRDRGGRYVAMRHDPIYYSECWLESMQAAGAWLVRQCSAEMLRP